MRKTGKPLLDVLHGLKVDRSPIWLMRQAGRYLPEYRSLRAQTDSFTTFCLTPSLASEATLQPLRRFDLDAAIVFADILLIPHAMGQTVTFERGEGPVLSPIRQEKDLMRLHENIEALTPVWETIECVKDQLDDNIALLGFCGGLWTVACYMIQGQAKAGFSEALSFERMFPSFLDHLFEKLHAATFAYVVGQIEAGADALQIFESHAGLLTGEAFHRWIIQPTKKLVAAVKAEYPQIPVIGFPRGAAPEEAKAYFEQTNIDALGLGQDFPMDYAKDQLKPFGLLQGNLDPQKLVTGGRAMFEDAEEILRTFGPHHIFNLGHGVLPQTLPEHVGALVSFVKGFKP